MRNLSLFQWLLLLPALLLLLLSLAVSALALSAAPPVVAWVAGVVVLVVGLWFFLGRRSPGINSEASLLGRQSSKEGLL